MGVRITDLPDNVKKLVLKQMQEEYVAGQKSKYKNQKTELNGISFASKKEAKRFYELLIMKSQCLIRNLKLQPNFTLQESYITPDGKRVRAIRYVADFSYDKLTGDNQWEFVVEDVKSRATRTPMYNAKKKMMLHKYGITVQEV